MVEQQRMVPIIEAPQVDLALLRGAIQAEYAEEALHAAQGFHFHTGRALARLLDYEDAWLEGIPEASIESFAGNFGTLGITFRARKASSEEERQRALARLAREVR